jgi:hypothetical protein
MGATGMKEGDHRRGMIPRSQDGTIRAEVTTVGRTDQGVSVIRRRNIQHKDIRGSVKGEVNRLTDEDHIHLKNTAARIVTAIAIAIAIVQDTGTKISLLRHLKTELARIQTPWMISLDRHQPQKFAVEVIRDSRRALIADSQSLTIRNLIRKWMAAME